ncbi:hypothetical protein B0H11DRAFT_1906971 [Mycena galericulata]|nr:hypothetical protein B0H11DRAFT_1906971 [Mycena galericulata]
MPLSAQPSFRPMHWQWPLRGTVAVVLVVSVVSLFAVLPSLLELVNWKASEWRVVRDTKQRKTRAYEDDETMQFAKWFRRRTRRAGQQKRPKEYNGVAKLGSVANEAALIGKAERSADLAPGLGRFHVGQCNRFQWHSRRTNHSRKGNVPGGTIWFLGARPPVDAIPLSARELVFNGSLLSGSTRVNDDSGSVGFGCSATWRFGRLAALSFAKADSHCVLQYATTCPDRGGRIATFGVLESITCVHLDVVTSPRAVPNLDEVTINSAAPAMVYKL